jgi:two-component system sensor histidine kinase/response regulator
MDHILLIDDHDAILKFLRKLLTDLGYKVEVAHDGEEGIKLVDNGYSFNLVITDINMPRMDGNAVAEYIRSSENPDTPIVALTASSHDDIKRDLFNFVLMKPFDLKALITAVKSFT